MFVNAFLVSAATSLLRCQTSLLQPIVLLQLSHVLRANRFSILLPSSFVELFCSASNDALGGCVRCVSMRGDVDACLPVYCLELHFTLTSHLYAPQTPFLMTHSCWTSRSPLTQTRFRPLQWLSMRALSRSLSSPLHTCSAPHLLDRREVGLTLWRDTLIADNVHATMTGRTNHFLARAAGQHCLLSQTPGVGGLEASGLRRLIQRPRHTISAIVYPPSPLRTMMRAAITKPSLLPCAPLILAKVQERLTSTIAV